MYSTQLFHLICIISIIYCRPIQGRASRSRKYDRWKRKIQQIIFTSPLSMSLKNIIPVWGKFWSKPGAFRSGCLHRFYRRSDDSSDSEDEVQGILNAAHEAGILGIVKLSFVYVNIIKNKWYCIFPIHGRGSFIPGVSLAFDISTFILLHHIHHLQLYPNKNRIEPK